MNHAHALQTAAQKICDVARDFKEQHISILGAQGGVVAEYRDQAIRLTFDDAAGLAVRAYLEARADEGCACGPHSDNPAQQLLADFQVRL